MVQPIVNVQKFLMTETEFVQFTSMTKVQFLGLVQGRLTVRDCLDLRRSLQVAQTEYRRTHPADDPRIWKSVEMWMKLERMAKDAFMRFKVQQILHFRGSFSSLEEARLNFLYHKMKHLFSIAPGQPKQARKVQAKGEWKTAIIEAKRQWEEFIRANSY